MGLRDIFRKIIQRDQHLLPHMAVVADTYVRKGPHSIVGADPAHVMSAAQVLESAYTMTEDISEDQQVALSMSKAELHAFVCYMRQLDSAYRDQGQFIARHLKPMGSPDEFKTSEEAAQVSPERFAQLTGEDAGAASQRLARELLEESKGMLQVAKEQLRAGRKP